MITVNGIFTRFQWSAYKLVWNESLRVVSQTFCELSKIILQKYATPEITFMVRISSWNFVRVPKAWLWAHIQSFSLKFSQKVRFLQYTNFKRIFWRDHATLVKQPPGHILLMIFHSQLNFDEIVICPTMSYDKGAGFKILHISQQICSHAMCKIGSNLMASKAEHDFDRIANEKSLVKWSNQLALNIDRTC